MWMPFRTSLAIATLSAAVLAFGVGDAAAQSCNAMRSELSRLSSGGGGASKSQIAALERQAKANGCRGTASWGRPRACAGIDAQISQLKRQGGGVSNPARVRQLQRAIARNCSQPQAQPQRQARTRQPAPAQPRNDAGYNPDRMTTHGSVIIHGTRPDNFLGSEAKQKTGFFGTLFGARRDPRETRESEPRGKVETVSVDPAADAAKRVKKASTVSGGVDGVHGIFRGGGMKTWCVRLCDGFYFPVSYSTTSSSYQQDLAICQHRCPGADVSLYSHPSYLDPEDMVSAVSGERYTKLPTAFAYRTKVTGNCSCELTTPTVKSAKADGDETGTPDEDVADAGDETEAADATVTAKALDADAAEAADGDAPAEEVEMAAVSPDVAGSKSEAEKAGDAVAKLATAAPEGEVSESGANVPNSTAAPVAAYADPGEAGAATPAEQKVVIDTAARPSADEVGVSHARPITEADLNVRKVGPTYYADQIAASAAAAQGRPNGR